MRSKLLAPLLSATVLISPVAQPMHALNEGTGHCHYCQHTSTSVSYSTNAFKVVYTVFGLFGSTQSCKETTTTKTHYTYCGPPLKKVVIKPTSGHGPEESSAPGPALGRPITAALNEYELRILDAETPCYGGIVVPDFESVTGSIRFIGLDGLVQNLPFTPVTGTLAWFLGPDFDPSGFDPAWVNSASWTGAKVTVQQGMLVEPSLIFTAGGDAGVPVSAVMNLDNPDQKVLHVDLGRNAAGTELLVLVSAKSPTQGALLVVDGITVPIVPDSITNAFLSAYPTIGGTADADGQATIDFPPISVSALEGVDLHVAVLAVDPITGLAKDASTFTTIGLRDLDICQ